MATAGPVITQWNSAKQHSDIERWVCLYPAYINSKKTRQEGRKVPKVSAVENPTYQEIRDVLQASNFKIVLENKLYPREQSKELGFRGRIRVALKNNDGTPLNAEFPTRDSILQHVGQKIPQLKSRQSGGGAAKEVAAAPAASSSSSNKKGKNKRR